MIRLGNPIRIGRHYGITFGRSFLRPAYEKSGNAFWYVQAFGITFWYDSIPAQTVWERGAW